MHALCLRNAHGRGLAIRDRSARTYNAGPVATVHEMNRHSSPNITLITSDVDGTLMNSQQHLSTKVENAVKLAVAIGVPLIVATGKARGPWAKEVLPRLGPPMPGVFLQGLLICDADGTPLYVRNLPKDVAMDCIELADKLGLTITAYCGERVLCATENQQTDRLKFYKEPTPEPVGPLMEVVATIDMQKLIFMAAPETIDEMRPQAEALLAGRASLTTAISGMLEVLPLGASKGAGVAWLLNHLGVDPENLMALGDGENDIEMLQLAGLGVAMGNAVPQLKSVADAVVGTNDEDGVAEAITKFVLEPRQQAKAAVVAL